MFELLVKEYLPKKYQDTTVFGWHVPSRTTREYLSVHPYSLNKKLLAQIVWDEDKYRPVVSEPNLALLNKSLTYNRTREEDALRKVFVTYGVSRKDVINSSVARLEFMREFLFARHNWGFVYETLFEQSYLASSHLLPAQ